MSQQPTTVTVTTPEGATTFVPQSAWEEMRDQRDELRRLVSFVQLHLFERDVQKAVTLLDKHGYGPPQARALRSVIASVRG